MSGREYEAVGKEDKEEKEVQEDDGVKEVEEVEEYGDGEWDDNGLEWNEDKVITSFPFDYAIDLNEDLPWHVHSEVEDGEWAEEDVIHLSVEETLQEFALKFVVALETIPEEDELPDVDESLSKAWSLASHGSYGCSVSDYRSAISLLAKGRCVQGCKSIA
ncbi:hypothetical protein DXG03_005538 [Asterophora parasitica]|uniref:Uncharacterized protein n=1 Tax=Asterophora parasitica TaxID=117018 RepID=A0A9P7G5W4_9AGAR|nr:hypothetical protein DXG03_005538 [Asterophora parasitica]